MLENLLIDIQHMQLCRYAFNTVRLVYLRVDILKALIKWLELSMILFI